MKLGYTIIYVSDVPNTVAFYETAFGLKCRFVHESNLYAEMETGNTVLSFAGNEAAEMSGLAIEPNTPTRAAAGWEICFVTDDVCAAYNHAVANGCFPISGPAEKPWGQTVSFVRDLNGCIVEIASPISTETSVG
jgi:predicted enzyme related to lactoylglutathione lyase